MLKSQEIVFTSIKDDVYGGDTQQDGAATKPAPADWGTLYFSDTSNDNDSKLSYVHIRFAGASYNYGTGTATAGLTYDSAATPISHSVIEFSNGYGLQLVNASSPGITETVFVDNNNHGAWLSAASSPSFSNDVFARNNGYAVYQSASSQATYAGNLAAGNKVDGIGVTGTLSSNSTWGTNLPYVIEGAMTISINTSLTIQPDAVIKFASGAEIIVNGWLMAQGTEGHPIFFTSIRDDSIAGDTNGDGTATAPAPGNWKSIRFTATSAASALQYVIVRYGGSLSSTGALYLDSGAPGLFDHITVMGSQYRGLYCQNTSPFIELFTFTANATGLQNGTSCYMMLQNNNIYGNTSYGVYNENTNYTLSAGNNWWGQATGPTHSSNPGGTGDRISDRITYAPFATTAFLPLPGTLPQTQVSPTPTNVTGTITSSTTWALSSSPYVVTGDVTVNAGVILSIEPGVVVKFQAGKNLTINGILNAVGTPEQRIIFTSVKDDSVGGDFNQDGSATWARPNDWGQILFGNSSVDTQTKLIQTVVRFGGSTGAVQTNSASPTISDNQIVQNGTYGLRVVNVSAPKIQRNLVLDNLSGGILLETTSSPLIEGNEIWGNNGYAVYMDATCYPILTGNRAFYNDRNGVRVSGTMTFNQTWYSNLPYIVDGTITINAGSALTIQPGTVVKFLTTASRFTVNGAISADATPEENITFTSIRDDSIGGDTDNDDGAYWPLPGDWGAITYNDSSSDAQDILDYVQIRFGGSGNVSIAINSAAPVVTNSTIAFSKGNGINLGTSANPTISNNTITSCTQDGLYITGSSAPTISNNLFTRNSRYAIYFTAESKPAFFGNAAVDNTYNATAVTGTFAGSATWPNNLTYLVADNLTLPNGSDLTIQPGAVVKFLPTKGITANGRLTANGSAGSLISFTSLKDDSLGGDTNNDNNASTPTFNDWGKITFSSTSINSSITYVNIHYGGNAAVKSRSDNRHN